MAGGQEQLENKSHDFRRNEAMTAAVFDEVSLKSWQKMDKARGSFDKLEKR